MALYDVVTFGETMIRLSPPHHARLETAESLDYRIGGSESNTAVALARLGRRVSWWSRLPESPLGRKIAFQVGRWGVDTSRIIWTETGRVGVYFIEFGAAPRPHHVYYDRADSAISHLTPDMVNWEHLSEFRHLHLSGITPALSPGCAATVARAAREAQERGLTVSFDINYRRKLWSPAEAQAVIGPLLADVNLLFCPVSEAELVFGVRGAPLEIARAMQEKFRLPTVIVTGSAEGVTAVDDERVLRSENVRAIEIDRIGSGDAGNGGILHGYLDGDLALGLRYGSAMAALKLTIPGDELIATKEEIESVMAGLHSGVQR